MTPPAIRALGEGMPAREPFRLHALPDGGLYAPANEPLDQFLLRLPLDVLEKVWANNAPVSEKLGPFNALAGYTSAAMPNGASSIEQGRPCLSLTRGLAGHMLRICSFAARHPGVFTDFPETSEAEPLMHAGTAWFTEDAAADTTLFYELAYPEPAQAAPRGRLGLLLTFDALHVAWLHEMAHVRRGHSGFLATHSTRLRMAEHATSDYARQPPLGNAQQAFEFDADHYAIRAAADLVYQGMDPVGAMLLPEADRNTRLGILLAAGCFLSLGWSALAQRAGAASHAHPAPHLRYYTLILGFSDVSESHIATEEIRDIQKWTFAQFSALTGTNSLFRSLAFFGRQKDVRKAADEALSVLQDELVRQQQHLAPFAYS